MCGNEKMEQKKISQQKKKVCVIGCGIAGLTTALYLAKEGFEVICVESNASEAQETSYLNGSIICPSLTSPWSNLGTVTYVLKSFFSTMSSSNLLITTTVDWKSVWNDPYFWSWIYDFIWNSFSQKKYDESFNASYQLSLYSKKCMLELLQTDLPEYSLGMATGSLQLFSDDTKREKQFSTKSPVIGFESLSSNDLKTIEPNLRSGTGGAIRNKMDVSGDIKSYCTALKRRGLELGVTYLMNSRVISWNLELNANQESQVDKNKQKKTKTMNSIVIRTSSSSSSSSTTKEEEENISTISADYFVFASGNEINEISLDLDDLQLSWPMRGYAIDAPISNKSTLVSHILADDIRKVYISPLNSTSLRISGIVDIPARKYHSSSSSFFTAGTSTLTEQQQQRALQLLSSASDILPHNYLIQDPTNPSYRFHSCFRPQTTDDLPVIGSSPNICNVYYNGGHGHLGFTRATGSSKLLVELIKSRSYHCDSVPSRTKIMIPQTEETTHLSPVGMELFCPQRFSNLFLKFWRRVR